MAQIINITSEALQATIRRLLPSQNGFGEDLQASNVITPIIDLTPTAEGSALPLELSSAMAFGSITGFTAFNTTVTVANAPGFYRIMGTLTVKPNGTSSVSANFNLVNGVTVKNVWKSTTSANANSAAFCVPFDFNVFLATNDSLTAATGNNDYILTGSSRQIADANGNIVNPSGFSFE